MNKNPPPLPGFVCRASDELMDEAFRRMNLAERGLFHSLRLLCWCNGSAPADLGNLAKMLGVERSDVKRAYSTLVRTAFSVEGDRLMSAEMERERVQAAKRSRAFSDAGKRGAEVRYGSRPTGQAIGQAIARSKEVMEERKESETNLASKENSQEHVRKILEQLASKEKMPTT